MSARHSQSLLLVWRVAEIEARNASASEIDLTHLWLGLCKVVDIDLPSTVSRRAPDREEVLEELLREIKRLRRVFRAGAMDACAFRRKLRAKAAERRFSILESTQLRRTDKARRAFADAEQMAAVSGSTVYPLHLLCAILALKDQKRDRLMEELAISGRRLKQLASQELMDPPKAEDRSNRLN